jgi:hypothetical protein
MHLRRKAFRYEIPPAGGKAETALDIPLYDLNWQLFDWLDADKDAYT